MIEQWTELKETIIELRDNDGTATQQEVCKFLANYMGMLERQMPECMTINKALEIIDGCKFKYKEDECAAWDGIMWHNRALEQVKQAIEAER